MKNILMGLALAATLSSAAFAGGVTNEKKAKKAKAENCEKKCEKGSGGPSCCMKKAQA
ncbi:hypothetical protein [Fibrella forsythiae]|uniref:Uncharacterized protein n=1 Tax=Fibrella forsythiae TaxID=2817061 RepID=A0ABS3JKZ4_9BACT|nr:hypothetical protein [Fibrella forsythiae]MBO0950667.1 hypothetical protein [Fibrella forsythiae]